ncbi:Gfo/Idh/MocA family protein [Streptomyces johnsoniae]|uniref:Gfo/Idh/MocA family oxidoreductase n=1 Tax=Streptomyces johnsoniae TaxID=3075532 RepID=A0ABU2SCN8_9ACTN|nr:Gfo/Idh/MocA family oxidoreductase [Streptomyces sp. DSM 41886]MDT0446713.1 Gfo/Idh/MocA family oxidoreductase [Streptomyces sp. DSM 41886]
MADAVKEDGAGASRPVPVVLAGARGHGRWHLRNIRRLGEQGLVTLAGVCDVSPLDEEELAGHSGVAQSDDLARLVEHTAAEVVVICTPIHTHAELGLIAARTGAHLLLEKPPTPSSAAFEQLAGGLAAAGTVCQVGFQSLGSHALGRIAELIGAGAIGTVSGIGAAGAWVRDESYWRRAAWGGNRRLDGRDVVDGVLTNPLAHAVATSLRIEGAERAEDIAAVDLELYRANDIAADDTSCARITTTAGGQVVAAVTLCAERPGEPYVVVHGDAGRITFWYKADRLLLERAGEQPQVSEHGRTDLLANLVAHLREGVPLLVPLARTGAFTRVVEAVRTAPDPLALPPDVWRSEPGDSGPRRVIPGIDGLTARGAAELALYSELAVDWARYPRGRLRGADPGPA